MNSPWNMETSRSGSLWIPSLLYLKDGSDVPDDHKLYTDFSMPGDDDYEDPIGWKQGLEEGEGSEGGMFAGV